MIDTGYNPISKISLKIKYLYEGTYKRKGKKCDMQAKSFVKTNDSIFLDLQTTLVHRMRYCWDFW